MRLLREAGEIRERYVAEDLEFDRYSDHTNKLVREGVREGEHKKASEIARKMLVVGRPLEEIAECSGLTKQEVEAMKTSPSHEDLSKSRRPLPISSHVRLCLIKKRRVSSQNR